MKNYYLEETIENLTEENLTREEAIKKLNVYYSQFTEEELLELLIRGEIHAFEDERTKGHYSR
jgi:hypothetical protein